MAEVGIATSESDYGKMWVKLPDGAIVDTTCPTDRTKFLIDLLNTNEFDMFITSGHGNVDMWQLHYPGARGLLPVQRRPSLRRPL